jgi:hypothetical protein
MANAGAVGAKALNCSASPPTAGQAALAWPLGCALRLPAFPGALHPSQALLGRSPPQRRIARSYQPIKPPPEFPPSRQVGLD